MRGNDNIAMGTDTEKGKHNPDVDNLRSLLKKSSKKENKKPNRVVFNENKNEFFDADYIILIREECDFDDEDDENVCTCYQHEMVRLTCCEPNCNCDTYEEFDHQTPQSPKFAPPIEFVDAVTLSPPEGYKDMELEEQELLAFKREMARRGQQRAAVCKECSAGGNDHEGEKEEDVRLNNDEHQISSQPDGILSDTECDKEKIDQSQQTTPTSPNTDEQRYLMDTLENNRREEIHMSLPTSDSVSGILKGGKLWRQQSAENNPLKQLADQLTKTCSTSDDESSTHRTVRFIETEEKKDSCKSSPEIDRKVEGTDAVSKPLDESPPENNLSHDTPDGAEPTEMTLTFKLGNHVLISNNSLKPNSAVRQLFPCTKPLNAKADQVSEQYVVTAESLRAFEEAKRSKLPQMIQNVSGTNESIKRVIERNTLRRSLLRYEPKSKKIAQKTDNSLVERIKQLTCDIDEDSVDGRDEAMDELSSLARVSPTGEEMQNMVDTNQVNKYKERNFSPSSSSTASSSSSSMSSTYRKITDLFSKREKPENPQPVNPIYETKTVQIQTLPDIGGPYHHDLLEKTNSNSKQMPATENRKQFLSTLAPLTACVSNINHPPDEHYYHLSNQGSLTSSTGSESYTLDDIEEALQNSEDKKITPDVLAGTPASESGDELANFVQQDANRIERIKKKYECDQPSKRDKTDEDDEHDDYGFNRRPSVRGIKPRFSSTTEILQEIQNQIQLPTPNANISWPYYSETNPSVREEPNMKPNYPPPYQQVPEESKSRGLPPPYRPESLYQNCANQSCYKEVYKTHSSFIEIDYSDYQTVPKMRNGRPMSPPPQELSKTYHQTMVYIPYNHIEGYQPVVNTNTYQANEYYRYNQNQINKKYIDPYYQQQQLPQQHNLPQNHQDNQYCNSNMIPATHKLVTQNPYPNNYQPLLVTSNRSESPLGNFSIARSTQTSVACMASCNYYPAPAQQQFRYRDSIRPPYKNEYVSKQMNRHSFPVLRPTRYPPDSEIYPEDNDHPPNGGQIYNGYYPYMPLKDSPANSPTKAKFIERGVPEGAASVSPQDSINNTTSTTTSPTMPHTITSTSGKPLFYAMNV